MSDIIHIPPHGKDRDERWERRTDDSDVSGVSVNRSDDAASWQLSITISVMEFIRENPLEAEIRRAMAFALGAVPGVARVAEEDREVWVVEGSPSGENLIQAAAAVVDRFAEAARAHIEAQ